MTAEREMKLQPTVGLLLCWLTCISSALVTLSAAARARLSLISFCTYLHQ